MEKAKLIELIEAQHSDMLIEEDWKQHEAFLDWMLIMVDTFLDNHMGTYFRMLVIPANTMGLSALQYWVINPSLLFNAFNAYIKEYLTARESYHTAYNKNGFVGDGIIDPHKYDYLDLEGDEQ